MHPGQRRILINNYLRKKEMLEFQKFTDEIMLSKRKTRIQNEEGSKMHFFLEKFHKMHTKERSKWSIKSSKRFQLAKIAIIVAAWCFQEERIT